MTSQTLGARGMPTTPRDRLCNMILLGDAFTAERFRDIWAGATERLAARVLAEPEGDQALGDFVLYVVALDTLMEAAKHINTLAKSRDLKTEIKAFTTAVPGLADTRDATMHFSDYQRGEGKQQKAGTKAERRTRLSRALERRVRPGSGSAPRHPHHQPHVVPRRRPSPRTGSERGDMDVGCRAQQRLVTHP
jgi:hypothetical protein